MKKQILFLMIIGILFSCNKNDDGNHLKTEIIGSWKLIQMTGSFQNSETTGTEMEWQETYRLNIDGTFQKLRNRDGVTKEASGIYNFDGKYLTFNFNAESEIIGSCSSGQKETMSFQSETIFYSSWNACDGPGLIYEKTE